MTEQPDLFNQPKPLAEYALADWDWRDCENARLAWNAATVEERRAWSKSIGMPHWPAEKERMS
jgi:hypothetical protein